MFAVPREKLVRIHGSSGTTGKPTVVGYTSKDIDTWADVVARSIRAAGGRPGDIVHVAYGYGLFTGGLGAHYGAERLGCTVVPISGGMTERQVTLMSDFKPRIIMVTPSYMLSILDEFRRQGLDPRQSSLQVGIFGAEPWTNAMRQEIEQAFDMHAVDIYGLSEVMGPGVANECVETKDGLHIWEDHFYPEIIDPVTGAVLPDGEIGELVFTTLTKEGLPMIRYRTRDLTRLLPGTARSMRRMEKITGRSDDMIILRGVNVFPTQIEEQILKCARPEPAFPDRADALGADGQHGGARGVRAACRGPGCAGGLGEGTGAPHQERGRGVARRSMSATRTRSLGPRARRSGWWTTGRSNDLRTNPATDAREGQPALPFCVGGGRTRRPNMARTRASDFEEKQHGILMSAAAVFAEQGMEKASMAQVASHSNVSKALLYHYYPSKDVADLRDHPHPSGRARGLGSGGGGSGAVARGPASGAGVGGAGEVPRGRRCA